MSVFRQEVRKNMQKTPTPSVGIIDSQSVKSRSGKKIDKSFDSHYLAQTSFISQLKRNAFLQVKEERGCMGYE